jgi:ferric-dicitrate binding protein FerR (iron transport regulator)
VQKIKAPFKPEYTRAAINAGIIVLAALLAWFFRGSSKLLYSCNGLSGDTEIPTGVYSCNLTLGNGCHIFIDSTYKGRVARQGNTEITRLPSGVLLYKKTHTDITNDTTQQMFNTIITSAGDQYQVILPDGSRVRLNAASSIRFPVEFSATERIITLQGEAFFDITPNKAAPFYVKAGNTEIRALGTSFNVNAYSENTVATLLSGNLEVRNNGDSVRLRPGQEAIAGFKQATDSKHLITVHSADIAKAVSWKKVIRVYKNVPLRAFVSDIGRWYDLEMLHTECIPDRGISATLCYETPLSEILKLLRKNGVRFMLEVKRIVFCPV